jgi:hypothetical protein
VSPGGKSAELDPNPNLYKKNHLEDVQIKNPCLLGNTKLFLMPDMFQSCRPIINESNIFQRKA